MYAWEFLHEITSTPYIWHLVKLQTDICIRLKCHFYEYYVVMMMSIQFILHTILLIINSYFALFICSVKCICCCSFTETNGFGFLTSINMKNREYNYCVPAKQILCFLCNGKIKQFYDRGDLAALMLLQHLGFVMSVLIKNFQNV